MHLVIKTGFELLTVVLGADQTEEGLSSRYLDTINLFEYGYSNYTLRDVIKKGNVVQTINIKNATRETKKLDAITLNDISVLIKMSDKDSALLPEVTLKENLKAPIKEGDIVGTVKYTVEGVDYIEDLVANNDVKKSRFFINTLIIIVIIAFIYLYLESKKKRRKNRRLRKRLKR